MELLVIIAVVLSIWALVRTSSLKKRVSRLERGVPEVGRSDLGSAGVGTQDAPAPVRITDTDMSSSPVYQPEPAATPSPFITWLKEDWLMKLGALLLILAAAWFVSYAFAHNWIGEVGRVTLGVALGLVFVVLGELRVKKSARQADIFIGLGVIIVIFSLWAARVIYEIIDPTATLVTIALVVAYAAFSSVVHDRKSLAVLSLAFGGLAPILTNSPEPSFYGLYSYIFVLVLGTLWVVALRGWRILVLIALVVSYLYTIPFLGGLPSGVSNVEASLVLHSFTLVFYIWALVAMVRTQKVEPMDSAIALMNSIALVQYVVAFSRDEIQSFLIAAWMLIFAGGAFLMYERRKISRTPFYIYSLISLGLLVVATSMELSGDTLALAFIVEFTLAALATRYLLRDGLAAQRIALPLALPYLMVLGELGSSVWSQGIFHSAFVVLLVLVVSLLALASYFGPREDDVRAPSSGITYLFQIAAWVLAFLLLMRLGSTALPVGMGYILADLATFAFVSGAIFGFAHWYRAQYREDEGRQLFVVRSYDILAWLFVITGVWRFTHAALPVYELATVTSLGVYTVMGIVLYYLGGTRGSRLMRLGGGIMIGLIVLRLIIVEFRELSDEWRIVAAFVVGLLLMGTAYVRIKKRRDTLPITDNTNS